MQPSATKSDYHHVPPASDTSHHQYVVDNDTDDNDDGPLSWREARIRMRTILEEYNMREKFPPSLKSIFRPLVSPQGSHEEEAIEEEIDQSKNSNRSSTSVPLNGEPPSAPASEASSNSNVARCWNRIKIWWFHRNMDFYCGSILCSATMMILSIIFLSNLPKTTKNHDMEKRIYESQLAGSIMFFISSCGSAWIIHRRQLISVRDRNKKKRNAVRSFLYYLNKMINEDGRNDDTEDDDNNGVSNHTNNSHSNDMNGNEDISEKLNISGNSLTDIYSVYRYSSNTGEGEWQNVPALLLVNGDYISLQNGDEAPSKCKLITRGDLGEQSNIFVDMGEKIHFPEATTASTSTKTRANVCHPMFPPGRSKLSSNSRHFLHLCRNTRIFCVLEAPVCTFLRRETGSSKSPLIHRKLNEIRLSLYLFSFIILIATTVLMFLRYGVGRKLSLSFLWHLPFLATISLLPVSTPFIAFLLEIIGSSRILTLAHPFALTKTASEAVSVQHFIRYFLRGINSRLSIIDNICVRRLIYSGSLVDFPPASTCLFERLGVVTALTVVDDELTCDPNSYPQQLLIPSATSTTGLKLLDLYPKFDREDFSGSSDEESDDEWNHSFRKNRKRTKTQGSYQDDSYSDSTYREEEEEIPTPPKRSARRTLVAIRRKYLPSSSRKHASHDEPTEEEDDMLDNEVQFEDPTWWHFLPSLKCIGLGCLLMDEIEGRPTVVKATSSKTAARIDARNTEQITSIAENTLVTHLRQFPVHNHFKSLARCIGFTTNQNSFGLRGDISPFVERQRVHVIATRLLQHRMQLDRHAIGLEESRTWGISRPDSTSVLVQDSRSKAHQLLSLGDARVITEFCSDAWQGENSTITHLGEMERRTILENAKNWSLADLEVTAFSYSPILRYVPPIGPIGGGKDNTMNMTYLVDNRSNVDPSIPPPKDNTGEEWALMKNQIFLGLLASSVEPRSEIISVIDMCSKAGIRFVYFSPRNMRRTKELASQMGIEMSWNCAISLRPLDEGEEIDEHRMKSEYSDWDVNAKLPHGVKAVKRHLQEVDNVPLLVSIYTDVTKQTTAEMVQVFQHYNDTVLTLGLSHRSTNDRTFAKSELCIGVDVLVDTYQARTRYCRNSLDPCEVASVCSLAAHSCVFNVSLKHNGLLHLSEIISHGRATLDAGTSAGLFIVTSYLSFSIFVLLSTCTAATSVPFVPVSGSALFLQLIIPILGLSMSFTAPDEEAMGIVPPKNVESITFAAGERKRLYSHAVLRAIPPAVFPQLIYLIAMGSLMADLERNVLVSSNDGSIGCFDEDAQEINWTSVIRCRALENYSGPVQIYAGCLMLAELALCVIALSASLLSRKSLMAKPPWRINHFWIFTLAVSVGLVLLYVLITLEKRAVAALPWYFFPIVFILPLGCVFWSELVKTRETPHEKRAEQLRRLQFETKLGMWSPK